MNFLAHKTAFIFDMDGTLVNSEPLKGEALAETCRVHGGKCSATLYQDVTGEKYEIVRAYFCEKANIILSDTIFDSTFKEIYLKLLDGQLHLTDGAYNFLSALKSKGFKTSLVSSAQRWQVTAVINKLEINPLLDMMITREDVVHHKPSPEAYLLAIEKLSVQAADVMAFEDSSAGLRAALDAGCQVIMIRHLFNAKQDFSGALKVIRSFEEII